MLGTITIGAQKSKERHDEIIETSLSVIHQLSMKPDLSIHPISIEYKKASALQLIGHAILDVEYLTEDKAKKGMQYLYDSQKMLKLLEL
jgi:hypothetical protein